MPHLHLCVVLQRPESDSHFAPRSGKASSLVGRTGGSTIGEPRTWDALNGMWGSSGCPWIGVQDSCHQVIEPRAPLD